MNSKWSKSILVFILSLGVCLNFVEAYPNINKSFKQTKGDTTTLKKIGTVAALDSQVQVYAVSRLYKSSEQSDTAALNDYLTVKVHHLGKLLRRLKAYDAKDPYSGFQNIRLFIDGREIKDLQPESGAPQQDDGTLHFHLQRNATNDDTWADILGSPKYNEGLFIKTCKVSIGISGQFAEDSTVSHFHLVRMKKSWLIGCIIGFIFYLIALFRMGKKSNLLKDGVQNKFTGLNIPNTFVYQYSLGRFQMAFWFSLVLGSFLFIWLITGAYDVITPSILGLIGISAGTLLSATVIDNSKNVDALSKATELEAQKLTLSENIAVLQKQVTSNPAPANLNDILLDMSTKTANLKVINQQLVRAIGVLTPLPSKGFFLDILSDVNGVSFHRLQMFVWTLVLGVLFISAVYTRLSMPEFSATMLGLQGLTAGTYLGFKIPEKQS